jgi:hypothetical protein
VGSDAPPHLRASDADREAAVGRLRVAAMEGRLDAEELAERVSSALEARFCTELDRLTADVTPAPVAPLAGPPTFVRPAQSVNPWAVASLVFSFVWFLWLGSVAAVISGHIALRQIRASDGRQSGTGVAIAGLALGYCGLAFLVAVMLVYAALG